MKELITKLALATLIAAAVAICVSCDDDCPACPEQREEVEPDYHVLYCCESRPPQYVAYEYSLKYGTTADSMFYDDYYGAFSDMTFSKDGSLAFYTKTAGGIAEPPLDSWTWVADVRTGDTLAICAGKGGHQIDLAPDGKYLLTSQARMITLFKLPALDVLYHEDWSPETDGFGTATFHPHEQKFYFEKQKRGQDSIFIATFDSADVTPIVAHPISDRSGNPVHPSPGSVSSDGKFLILDAAISLGPKYFMVLDTDSLSIVHETRIADSRLHIRHAWHPDGKRVFMSFNGAFHAPDIGGVDVYDITTNVLQYFITSEDISLDMEPFQPGFVSVTGDGRELIVMNGIGALSSGSILTIDLASKLLTKRIDTYEPSYYSYAMALIPIDWEKEE